MSKPSDHSPAFDHIADEYDADFTHSMVGQMQRQRVHAFLQHLLDTQSILSVLELNCGTGEDAIWLADKKCTVLATDISAEMVATAQKKARLKGFDQKVEGMVLAAEGLSGLPRDGSFDLIFSNFGGLNCLPPEHLPLLAQQAHRLLRPGGHFVAVVMSSFCWWESLYFLAKGRWKEAWRRRQREAVKAPLSPTVSIDTWYYSPKRFRKGWGAYLEVQSARPVGFFLPPSYLDPTFQKAPAVLRGLNQLEKWSLASGGFAACADHFLIHFLKK